MRAVTLLLCAGMAVLAVTKTRRRRSKEPCNAPPTKETVPSDKVSPTISTATPSVALPRQLIYNAAHMVLFAAGAISAYRGTWDVTLAVLVAGGLLHFTKRVGRKEVMAIPAKAEDQVVTPTAMDLAPFCAFWVKVPAACEDMTPALHLMKINGLIRTAIKLVKGIQLKVMEDHSLELAYVSVVTWFKIRERYPLDGKESYCRRRDMRRGDHCGRLRLSPRGNPLIVYSWEEPHKGCGTDELILVGDKELHVVTTLEVGGQQLVNTQVYRRVES